MSIATLTLVAGFGSAVAAGVFFAFSTFVMNGLGRVEPNEGMRAMQGINEAAVTAPFMILLFGTAVVALVVGGLAFSADTLPNRAWLLAGVACYLVGIVVVTVIGNVPMNDALARLSASEPANHAYWTTYLSRWTLINHVRTIASAGAAIAFFIAFFIAYPGT